MRVAEAVVFKVLLEVSFLTMLHIPSNLAPSSMVMIAAFKLPVKYELVPKITFDSTFKSPSTVPLIVAFLADIFPLINEPFAELIDPLKLSKK